MEGFDFVLDFDLEFTFEVEKASRGLDLELVFERSSFKA